MEILKKLGKYYIYMVSIFFIGRLSLFILYFDHFSNSSVNYWLSFIYGLRMDTIAVSILLILPVILLTLSPKKLNFYINTFLKYYFLIVISIIIYIEIATFPFISQYDVRPNYLFVEYLEYPKEVFSTIFTAYKLELFMAFLIIGSFIYWYIKVSKENFIALFEIKYIKRISLFLPLLIILFLGIRSSFGHRPANISDAMYSPNRMLNEITKNSMYSIGYAIYVNKKHGSEKIIKHYGKMQTEEAFKRVSKRLNINTLKNNYSLLRLEKSHFKNQKPKNLVIFLQESIGYQFVEALGGAKDITPNINKLSKEGIFFKDLYSNGTRSIRGIAGTVAGNFSIPGKGVVKRNKSQSNWFTISSLLKPFGYYTSFIYGGESRFDNMKSWFLGNGFDEIIDQPKFKDPTFIGTWGVSDEDMVIRANEEFKKLYAKNQKFATVMFSTSNHSPFDFPENKITLVDGVEKKSDINAIKYADYAIGKFIELAKKEDYYKDTVFVIVADHNVRVYGNEIVPVNMFQIPGLILGKDIKPLTYDKLATQPDILATALDLIGLDLKYPIMGHSIFSGEKQNLSLMQFNSSYALRVDDKIAIVRPNKKATTFLYKEKKLIQIQHDVELEKDLLALIVTLDYFYKKGLYKQG